VTIKVTTLIEHNYSGKVFVGKMLIFRSIEKQLLEKVRKPGNQFC